jgi:F420-dependent oxidoreductase-like protein
MRAPITLDLHMPNFNYPGVPDDGLLEHLVKITETAERSGFTSITMMDHLHQIPPVGTQDRYMFDGNTVLAALAGRTSEINLGLLVGGVTYRNPAHMAKITTGIDVLSGGRAFLGIGAAWFEDEHKAYGYDFPPLKERFERLEDTLRIARAMFTEERATVAGKHHSVTGAYNNPKPIRGDIPILIGGSGERKTLRFVAKYADGCNVFGDPDTVRHLMGVLGDHCENEGRDPSEITKTRNGTLIIGQTTQEAEAKLREAIEIGWPEERVGSALVGDPDTVGEEVQKLLDAGLDGVTMVVPTCYDLDSVALAGETLAPLVGSAVR